MYYIVFLDLFVGIRFTFYKVPTTWRFDFFNEAAKVNEI
jgi:hypothetical protein